MLELRCPTCQRLLRVADDALGRQARCPACAAVVNVTADATHPPQKESQGRVPLFARGEGPADDSEIEATLPYHGTAAAAVNPWRAWTARPAWSEPYRAESEASSTPEPVPRIIQPKVIDIGQVFSQSWNIFQSNLGAIVGAVVVVYLLDTVCGMLINVLHHSAANFSNNMVTVVGVSIVTYAAGTVFTVWLTTGLIQYLLRIARGEPAHFGQLFEAGPLILPAAITTVFYSLIVTVGLLACVVPGIILGLMYWMALPLVIDARKGVVEAFTLSQQVTNGNKLALAGVWLISIGLIVAGGLLCGLGLIVALPFVAIFQTVTYLAMTGQPIAIPAVTTAAK